MSVPPGAVHAPRIGALSDVDARAFEAHRAAAVGRFRDSEASASVSSEPATSKTTLPGPPLRRPGPYASSPRSSGRTSDTIGSHLPGVDPPADLTQLLAVRLDDEPDGTSPVTRLALRRTRHGDRHEAAARPQHVPRPLPCLAADRVEHEIEVGDDVLEALRPVVDHLVGAELPDQFGVACRAGRRDVGALAIGRTGPRTSRRRRPRHGPARADRVASRRARRAPARRSAPTAGRPRPARG